MQHIDNNIDLIDQFYMMGFRVYQWTYNMKNQIGMDVQLGEIKA